MKELGIYRKEYRTTIDIFVDMVHQYEVFTEEFEKQGYKVQEEYTNKAGATNMRKPPHIFSYGKIKDGYIYIFKFTLSKSKVFRKCNSRKTK